MSVRWPVCCLTAQAPRGFELHASLDSTAIVIDSASHPPRRASIRFSEETCEAEIERYDWQFSIARRFVLVVAQLARIDFGVRF